MKRITKIKIEGGYRGTCDFCHKKGDVYRLRSTYRSYRFLNVCSDCLKAIRSAFRKAKF